MKKVIAAVCFTMLSLSAFAGVNPYVKGNIGYNYMNYKADFDSVTIVRGSSLGLGGAIGNKFSDKFRAEFAYAFTEVDVEKEVTVYAYDPSFDCRDEFGISGPNHYCAIGKGISGSKIKQHLFMLNGFYYPLEEKAINPFIGAGMGWGFLKKVSFGSDSANNFAYALYVGADYNISPKLTLEISGNYTSMVSPISDTKDIYNFGANVGIRYSF
jgi:opacity protein-like surface antigen